MSKKGVDVLSSGRGTLSKRSWGDWLISVSRCTSHSYIRYPHSMLDTQLGSTRSHFLETASVIVGSI